MKPLIEWIEHRTGLESAIRQFLYEEIPASSGWHQVFGSVAMFLFLTQAFTGIMLAFNYAPTPGEAYNSLRYILTELTAGRLMRGLHHWGASMMIVVVVLHMVQVFLWGAYKKPREATWMAGIVLLLLTLGFGLTGYLLPWDNRAYWGTVVTTQIASKAPFAGPYLLRLLGSDGDIGVVTFARFYGLHVLLLPPATMLLIAFHVFLVRKHGVAPAPSDEGKPMKPFYPGQVFKDTLAIFIAFTILFVMAVAVKVPLEQIADPTDTSYVPRPEWYFLFLFQTLKFFEGPLEIVGSIVLPTIAILLLALAPFIDRGKAVAVSKRTFAFAIVLIAGIGWSGLTLAAMRSTPKKDVAVEVDFGTPTGWTELTPEELAGVGYFRKENCQQCHNTGDGPPKPGPDLSAASVHKTPQWMLQHFRNPARVPGAVMPPVQLNDSQLNTLALFLTRLTPKNAESIQAAPQPVVDGAMIYQANRCGACHQVNGSGMKTGPALNGLSRRRDRAWLVQHFRDPQKMSPGTIMPPYRFPNAEMEAINTYLLTLQP